MDGEFRTTFASQITADLLGYAVEEMIHRPVTYGEWLRLSTIPLEI